MIYRVSNKISKNKFEIENQSKDSPSFDYSNVIVKKPWGYEYLVFKNDFVAIWMLQIVRKRKTVLRPLIQRG